MIFYFVLLLIAPDVYNYGRPITNISITGVIKEKISHVTGPKRVN